MNETGLYGVNYDIQNDSGDILTTPSHKGLQGKMLSQGIKVGQYVQIVFQGENPPSVKGQNPTKKYDLYVEE